MANLGGFQMKNIKFFPSMEYGPKGGISATLYLDGKKAGNYIDYGNGGCSEYNFVSKEAEENMVRYLIDYAKSHRNPLMENILKKNPDHFEKSRENFINRHPGVAKEDITMSVLAAYDLDYAVDAFLKLHDTEKYFKGLEKKGYGAVSVQGPNLRAYPKSWTTERVMAEVCKYNEKNAEKIENGKCDKAKVFFSLDDFNISRKEMLKDITEDIEEEEEREI